MRKPKNIALVMAGGVGARMKSPVSKQFHMVKGKPVIVYTLEAFQQSVAIDEIVVVLLSGWTDILEKYIREYQLTKVTKIVLGGDTGFQSIRNGVNFLKANYEPEDIILIHDAVRPLLSEAVINNNIAGVEKYGNAITVVPTTEALLYSEDGIMSERIVDRSQILRTQTPQSLRLGDLAKLHEDAVAAGVLDTVATCTLLVELGRKVYAVEGDNSNFKLTMPEDVALFEAYLDAKDKK